MTKPPVARRPVLIELFGGLVIGGSFSIAGVSLERGQFTIAAGFAALGGVVTMLFVAAR